MEKFALVVAAIVLALIGVVMLTDDRGMKNDAVNFTKNATVVGVVMNGPLDDDGWSTAHHRGFEAIRDELNLDLRYLENVATGADADAAVDSLVQQGAKIIFATSFGFGPAVVKGCDTYPDVVFFHCSGLDSRPNLTTYMGRIYQMRYLSGVVAGLQTGTAEIGYVAAMKIDEVVRGINAFTLGVRSVNPRAVVHVAWTGTWVDRERERAVARQLLAANNIDVLAYHQDSEGVIEAAVEKGIAAVGYNVDKSVRFPETVLVSPIWNWAPFYRRHIRAVIEREFKPGRFWDGVDTGIVDLSPVAAFAKPGVREAVARERARLEEGNWDVFFGPLVDNRGAMRVEAGSSMSDGQLLGGFDWFVDGVVEAGE